MGSTRTLGHGLALVAVAALAILPVVPAAAAGIQGGDGTLHVGGFYVGAGLMQAWGDAGFTISGRDAILGRFSSVLEFPMDATYLVLESGIDQIGPGFGVHLRYGTSAGIDGTTVDTDYAWQLSQTPYIRSLAGTDGDNVFLTLDVTYCLIAAADSRAGTPVRLDVFAGYHMQDATFEISDVRTVIERTLPAYTAWSGVAATYDMEFSGLRVGLRGEMGLGAWGTISGSLAVLPLVDAEGFGQWIFREKVVDHDATGWGLDFALRYEYAFSSSVRVWGGVGYTRLEGSGGTDTQFRFSGDPIGRARLDELASEYRFAVIGGEFRF
jgi:hypothetical protein